MTQFEVGIDDKHPKMLEWLGIQYCGQSREPNLLEANKNLHLDAEQREKVQLMLDRKQIDILAEKDAEIALLQQQLTDTIEKEEE